MESEFIAWLRKRLPPLPRLGLGLSDDAAVLQWRAGDRHVVTTDLLADGVHFQLEQAGAVRVGRKSLAVNLSDIAAMAAQPHSAFVSVLLPRSHAKDLAVELYNGLVPLADQFGVAIAGGDTNCWDGPLVVSVTAIGAVTERGPLLRGGARPGDAVIVTGSFGGSILGRHYDFQPRVEEALLLTRDYTIHAGMDVSDGLSIDLWRLCEESRCGAVLDIASIPVSADARKLAEAEYDTEAALQHALADGEDFELILAAPPAEAERMLADQPLGVPLTRIGDFVTERELLQQDAKGTRKPLAIAGYEHGLPN